MTTNSNRPHNCPAFLDISSKPYWILQASCQHGKMFFFYVACSDASTFVYTIVCVNVQPLKKSLITKCKQSVMIVELFKLLALLDTPHERFVILPVKVTWLIIFSWRTASLSPLLRRHKNTSHDPICLATLFSFLCHASPDGRDNSPKTILDSC